MANNCMRGVIVPILTPLHSDETVDVESLRRLTRYLLDNGVHGIWASGTTGEFPSLSDKERLISIETVVDEVAGRVPVIGNISGSSTQHSVGLAMSVQESGLDGIAATPPFYYPHAQDEILDHYRYISDRTGPPLWVYNFPQMVKTAVAPGTLATLASTGAVVGVKDSSGSGEPLAELSVLCEQGGRRPPALPWDRVSHYDGQVRRRPRGDPVHRQRRAGTRLEGLGGRRGGRPGDHA